MKDLMDFLKAAFESPMNTLITIILFILAIKGIYESVRWIKIELNAWYKKRNLEEELGNQVGERLDTLEQETKNQSDKLESIDATLQNISASIEMMAANSRNNTVAICRSSLWNWYENVKNREFINSAEYETIMDLSKVYLDNNGNSVFKNKIIPYLQNVPVKD